MDLSLMVWVLEEPKNVIMLNFNFIKENTKIYLSNQNKYTQVTLKNTLLSRKIE